MSKKTNYKQLWEVRKKLYVDWTIRDILYRLLIRARLEGIYHYTTVVIDKIAEDVRHLDEVFTVMDVFRSRGFLTLLLEPAYSIADFIAIKNVHIFAVEVKTHQPPYVGHTDIQLDYYKAQLDELTKHGIQLLYVWFNRNKKAWECTSLEHLDVHENKVIAKKVWKLDEFLKTY